MKNILSICFTVLVSISFAQENSSNAIEVFNNENKTAFSLTTMEDAKLLKFQEVVPIEFEKRINVNEGKFSLKEINDKSLTSLLSDLDKNAKTKFLIIEEVASSKESSASKKSIIIVANQKFINKLISSKIIQDELIAEAITYGDKNLEYSSNYPELVDILNVKHTISEDLELQIGNNIYSFINNPFKTVLDKTLSNSLNLLAFNF
ncbi:hypothetical protein K8354_01835 [Polaribacter litorisediminis]|uniref:hypothetical protein n=1 Tax=Polaribacter litorisediminis TaxID=1908341 RepID=UPI001CBB2C63|nr:hypothetical protein [Polaribacter litorisediminis]UAM98596.1 hypothetical protein K8354_01835 [Polaribacter litorisediminis]